MGIRLTSDESTGLSRGLGADETAQVGMGHACVQRARGGHAAATARVCVSCIDVWRGGMSRMERGSYCTVQCRGDRTGVS